VFKIIEYSCLKFNFNIFKRLENTNFSFYPIVFIFIIAFIIIINKKTYLYSFTRMCIYVHSQTNTNIYNDFKNNTSKI